MVYLYGVTHGGKLIDPLTEYSKEMKISPSKELLADLRRFPAGTKVGIESLSKKDLEEINSHLSSLPFNPPEPRFEDQEFALRPFYETNTETYWDKLREVCSDLGFCVEFLEDKNIWFRYNEAIVKTTEDKARRGNLLVLEKGESKENYKRKRIGFNVEKHKEDISARKIHEIERDSQLLKAIKSLGVNIALVGVSHSEYWIANPKIMQSDFGIKFDSYSTEFIPKRIHSWEENITIFNKYAKPDSRRAFDRNSLEREIRLIETGKLSDAKPTYVGTWNIDNPLEGYFEMFVDKEGKTMSGKIVDCNGDAEIKGKMDNKNIKFIKKYKPDSCSKKAYAGEIPYKGIIRNGNIMGYFTIDGFGEPFYATPGQVNDFSDLGMSWISFARRYKKGMKSLRERLFD